MQEIQPSQFESFVSKPLVLVDFFASWCSPCKMIAPHLAALASAYGDKMSFGKLDTDKAPAIMRKYGIRGVPTLMIFRNGADGETLVGAHPKPQIEAFIQKAIGAHAPAARTETAEERAAREARDVAVPRRGFRRGPL